MLGIPHPCYFKFLVKQRGVTRPIWQEQCHSLSSEKTAHFTSCEFFEFPHLLQEVTLCGSHFHSRPPVSNVEPVWQIEYFSHEKAADAAGDLGARTDPRTTLIDNDGTASTPGPQSHSDQAWVRFAVNLSPVHWKEMQQRV